MVYQLAGKTDPKDPRRYKRLSSNLEKLTPHTVQINEGSLLRRSGISFRSAAEEIRAEKGNDPETPGPSKPREPKVKALKKLRGTLKKRNQTMKWAQMDSEERKRKKRRLLESSDEESDEKNENENARTNVRQEGKATRTTATKNQSSEANKPSGTAKAILRKTVGQKRKISEEVTRRSTRQRKGVDKMGGMMIHRIEYT